MSGMSGEEDFRRAEIWSRVATVFVLIPMYNFFILSCYLSTQSLHHMKTMSSMALFFN